MIVSLGDNGKLITLKLRERLEVRLPESQVSGYLWEYRHTCPCLQLEDSDYGERGEARFTGLGERWWRFTSIATGECELSFSLIRPWSKPSPEYRLKLRVS